jgi:hypothetical protein
MQQTNMASRYYAININTVFFNNLNTFKFTKVKGKVRPTTGHEGPERK